jgi:hypothetical protein
LLPLTPQVALFLAGIAPLAGLPFLVLLPAGWAGVLLVFFAHGGRNLPSSYSLLADKRSNVSGRYGHQKYDDDACPRAGS